MIQNQAPSMNDAIVNMPFVSAVIDFNQRVLGIEPRDQGPMIQGEYEATVRALNEETQEFKDAYQQGDFIGQIDALVDSMYFAIGALYKMGLNARQIERIQTAVHLCNMEKKLGVVERRGNPLGDAVKPEGWSGPEEKIAKILDEG